MLGLKILNMPVTEFNQLTVVYIDAKTSYSMLSACGGGGRGTACWA